MKIDQSATFSRPGYYRSRYALKADKDVRVPNEANLLLASLRLSLLSFTPQKQSRTVAVGILKLMNDSSRFTIICPCCDATLTVDADTGALLSHEEKHKPLGSFEDMVKDLDKQKLTREQIFAQEMSSHKDRGRLLEEKFQEAKKKAEKDTKIYRNPLDLD